MLEAVGSAILVVFRFVERRFGPKKNTLAHEDLQDRKKNAGEASASGAEAEEGPVFGGTDGDLGGK